MPKQKSRKSLTNRIKVTKNGKLLRRQSFRRHLKAGKSHKRLSHLKRQVEVVGFYAKKLRKAMGVKKAK
ncbi:MAG: bL35 family ribosomal protein [Patescibacteria group bacterium]